DEEYEGFINAERKRWVEIEEEMGLEVVVEGELERREMVE
ncbi:hypothetical protein, partial [Bacillus velezensis]